MRQTVYKCDHCKIEIGDKIHISLSCVNYSGIAVPPEVTYQWEVKESLNNKFMHFCDQKCISIFFKTLIDKVKVKSK